MAHATISAWATDTYPDGALLCRYSLSDPSQDIGYYWQDAPHRRVTVQLPSAARVIHVLSDWPPGAGNPLTVARIDYHGQLYHIEDLIGDGIAQVLP